MTRSSRLLRSLALVLVCAALFTLLPLSAPEASAAGNYSVRQSYESYSNSDWYYVSTPSFRADVPTFYSSRDDDVYVNIFSGSDIRIRFYRAYETATREEAEALAKYLATTTNKAYSWAYYSFQDPIFNEKTFVVLFVEGVNLCDSRLEIEPLINKNPWENNNRITMILHHVGAGDLRKSMADWIRDELECSKAVFFGSDYGAGNTYGFSFYDWSLDDSLLFRYCAEEWM